MQSVPSTTKIMSLNPAQDEAYSTQLYVVKFSVTCGRSMVFSSTPVSSTGKSDRHDITEIILKKSVVKHHNSIFA